MGIKQLYNDNLRKLLYEYGDVSVMQNSKHLHNLCLKLAWDELTITTRAKYERRFCRGQLNCIHVVGSVKNAKIASYTSHKFCFITKKLSRKSIIRIECFLISSFGRYTVDV